MFVFNDVLAIDTDLQYSLITIIYCVFCDTPGYTIETLRAQNSSDLQVGAEVFWVRSASIPINK